MIEDSSGSRPEQHDTDECCRDREHRWRGGASVWVGIALILIGLVFILQVTHLVKLDNWWALFILIPALASLGSAVSSFVRSRRFTRSVAGSLGSFLLFGALAVIFLFNMDWSTVWPVFIVIAGLSVLMNAIAPRDRIRNRRGDAA